MIRFFDIFFSLAGLILLTPLLILLGIAIKIDSYGEIIYKQNRVGQSGGTFTVYKLRTMVSEADKSGLLTTGETESRITRVGYYLRRYKLDELPQLFNVLKGNMSLVGPRPEVKKYVDHYSEDHLEVLELKPGITGPASIEYSNEGQLLEKVEDPEEFYKQSILPRKNKINIEYFNDYNLRKYFKCIFLTLKGIFSS